MVLAASVVAQQERGAIVNGDQHIHSTIIIEVAEGEAPCGEFTRKNRAAIPADVLQAGAGVSEKEKRLRVRDTRGDFVDQIIRVCIGDQEVEQAIVVEVKKLGAPAA